MKILDTDVLIAYLRGNAAAATAVEGHLGEVATTTINAAELFDGAASSQNPESGRDAVESLLALLTLVPFGPRAAKKYGELAGARRKRGLTGGPLDLLIASVAVAEEASVLTRNVRDFEGHVGLRVETW